MLYRLEEWVEAVKGKRWTLAGHISRRSDGRWSTLMLDWQPEGGGRSVGQPARRWSDEIERHDSQIDGTRQGDWRIMAEDRKEWQKMQQSFKQGGG